MSVGVLTFAQVTSKRCQYSHNVVLQRALLARVLPHFRFGDSELHSRNVNGILSEASNLICRSDG